MPGTEYRMDRDRQLLLETLFEDISNETINEYLREIKENFVKKYDLNKFVESEVDFLVGIVVNEIFNRIYDLGIRNNTEITNEERIVLSKNIHGSNSFEGYSKTYARSMKVK